MEELIHGAFLPDSPAYTPRTPEQPTTFSSTLTRHMDADVNVFTTDP